MLERRAVQEAIYIEAATGRPGDATRDTPAPPPPSNASAATPADRVATEAEASSSAPAASAADDRSPLLPSRPANLCIVACLTSRAPPVPYIFRNYEYPPAAEAAGSASTIISKHAGTSSVPLWQALRATTAAPSYFQGLELRGVAGADDADAAAAAAEAASSSSAAAADGLPPDVAGTVDDAALLAAASKAAQAAAESDGRGLLDADHPTASSADPSKRPPRTIFQDGGLLANNPSAIALHEARLLFPSAPIACLASFGTGAFAPVETRPGSWSAVVSTLVRAATRTEEVHQMLSNLLPVLRVPYYRFNPQVPVALQSALDETSPKRLAELQDVGRNHVLGGRGAEDLSALSQLLTTGRGRSASAAAAARRKGLAALLQRIGNRVRSKL